MLTKIAKLALGFGLVVAMISVSSTGAEWAIFAPLGDGSYEHLKTANLSTNGTGNDWDQAVIYVHTKGDSTQSWINPSPAIDTVGGTGNPSDVWEFTNGTCTPDSDGNNTFPPFFDHDSDMDPNDLVFPPGAEGSVKLYKEVGGIRSWIVTHHFSVTS